MRSGVFGCGRVLRVRGRLGGTRGRDRERLADGIETPRANADPPRGETRRARSRRRGLETSRRVLSAVFVRVVDRDAAPSAPAPAEPPQRLRDGQGRLGERTLRSNGERGGKRARARVELARVSSRRATFSLRREVSQRSRRDARSFDARADARRRVQTRRDARSVATGRSRIRNDVGVASMTRCAEVTGVDVASTAAVVLGCPGWIVRGAYPACGSPRRPHPACGSPRRPRSACGSPRRPRSACGSPRRRDGAGAIFPSMDETTPRPSPIGEGRVRAARRASSSEKASRDAGRGGRGRTRAEACATTSPVGNAKKCREAIACVGEGGDGTRGRLRDWSREGGAFLIRRASRSREGEDVRVAREVVPAVSRDPEGGYRANPLRHEIG